MSQPKQKTKVGQVVSNKMNKTVVVAVTSQTRHPRYGKIVRILRKFKAHDEGNSCSAGDLVRIEESKPISKEKRWRVAEILAKGTGSKSPLVDETGVELQRMQTE